MLVQLLEEYTIHIWIQLLVQKEVRHEQEQNMFEPMHQIHIEYYLCLGYD